MGGVGTTQRYRRDIDGLRAVAILAVVAFHAGVPFIPGGFVGVDVFFVISGYLIAGIVRAELEEGAFSLARFYERRARRILPALLLMIAAALAAGWAILLPSTFVDFAETALGALFSVSNFQFWHDANNYFREANHLLPLLHTWSLGVEEQFYVVAPLALLAIFRWRRAWLPALMVFVVAVLFLGGAYVAAVRPAAGFYLTPFRAWELGVGVLLAVVPPPKLRTRVLREAATSVGLAAILAACLIYSQATPFPGVAALLPTLGAAAVIQGGVTGGSMIGRLLSIRPMVFIGLISYSLYLWHWPILAFLRVFFGGVNELSATAVAVAVGASFVVATLSWRFVERPFRRRDWLSRRQVLLLSLAGVGVLAAVAGYVIAREGVSERFGPDEQPLVQFIENPVSRASCGENAFVDPACALGVDGVAPVFLLWGDSHARAISPAVSGAARLAGVGGVLAWSSSCPALTGVIRVDRDDCNALKPAVLDALRLHPTIHTVILAGRWVVWEQNNARPDGDPRPAVPEHVDDPTLPGEPGEEGILAFGLGQTLDVLVGAGYSVVIIGTAPEFAFYVPEGLLAQARWGIRLDVTNAAAYAERNREVAPLLQSLGQRPGVTYVRIDDVLCPDNCIIEVDGLPAFRDRDHLSSFGATSLLTNVLGSRIFGVAVP